MNKWITTTWPYHFNDEVMSTQLWEQFIQMYKLADAFYLAEQETLLEVQLEAMYQFLKAYKDTQFTTLVDECIQYLEDMPGWRTQKLLVHIINR